MSFFDAITNNLLGNSAGGSGPSAGTGPSPALRSDLYKAISATETWLSTPGAPGDGLSFRQVFTIIQPHCPNLKAPIPIDEVAVLVGAITNLTFELGKVDGMAGVMVIQAWCESLERAFGKVKANQIGVDEIGSEITRGVNSLSDPGLVTRELAPRVQTVSSLKRVAAFVYGPGSEEARQADAYWSSKMMI
ncbi:hypothetical protein FRC03_005331 [Tulasnella sp. 419]|nr:hypothetical protein FRC02_001327 [Tulasnella sp. 418]KAG8961489.1 hypothetical protein FRC03_005331 [Tulasnella sp. 419]